ncbi:MAG: hypothetical protein K2X87_30840, partial [Gemmataceae bacterium]|nr:hypothetical protein [Gemmataceae bacterium]
MKRFYFQVLIDRLCAAVWRAVERRVGLDVAVAEAVIDHEARRAVLQFQQELAALGDAEGAAAVGEALKAFDRP